MFKRIAYTLHASKRMRERRISRGEVKRIINEPELTYPGNKPGRIVGRGLLDDERLGEVVYTEEHDRADADVLIVTVIELI